MKKFLPFILLSLVTSLVFAQPVNDDCVNRTTISVTTAAVSSYSIDLTTATESVDASCDNAANDNLDVWYEFTMPVNGNVRVNNIGSADGISFFDSCGGTELTCFNGNGFVFNLSASTTYVLRVSRRDIFAGVVNFDIQAFATLANDECVNRTTIAVTTGGVSSYSVDIRAATESIDTSCDNASNSNLDVWYEFTMPVNGNVRVNSIGSADGISFFDSCGGTELTCFYGNGFVYNLSASTTYVLRISRRDIFAGVINFDIEAFETLGNDECANRTTIAVTIAGVSSYSVDIRAATESVDASCNTASNDNLDAWYEFTMPVNGNIRVNNIGGTDGVTLYDSCGGTELDCFFGNGFVYNLSASTTYVLRISRRDIFAGVVNFDIEAFETLANDECVNRTTIAVTTGGVSSYSIDLRAATESVDASCNTASNDNLDAWYEFTMPVNGNIRVNNIGGSDGVTLYDSCGGTELDCFFGNGFVYNLSASTIYVLRISRRDIFAGVVNFDIEAFETVANDECVNRTTIAVTTGGVSSYSIDLRAATESLDASCNTASNDNLDAWYEFTMPVDGNIRVNNIGGSDGIALYDSCGGTEIACFFGNDFVYNLSASTIYVLRISRRDIFAGIVNFDVEAFETAVNDECVNASTVNVGIVAYTEVSYDLRAATESLDASCDNAANTNLDLWYEFVMPVQGNIDITNVTGSDGVSLFDTCGGTELDCFYGNGLFFGLTSGSTFYLRLSRRSLFANAGTFRIQAIEAPLAACAATTQFIGGSWDNGDPNITTNAIIRSLYNTATNGNFTACSLAIDSGTTLTVNTGGYVEVAFGIDNNGILNVDHQGNLVQRDAASVALNNGNINVNVTTPFLKPRDFMVMGSPMDSETRNGVFGSGFRFLKHTTVNFDPDATVAAMFPAAENFADGNGDNWNTYTGLVTPAEGYLVWPQASITDGNTTYDLTYSQGTLNNGDISFPVIFNTTKNDSPNILANPYASAISANDFINLNTMVDEVYFWEHLTPPSASLPGYNTMNFSMEDISMYNLMGGVAAASDVSGTLTVPDGFISTGQGFGIKASAMGTAMFTNSMRRLSNNNTLRSDEVETDRIWLSVQNETYQMQNSTLIGFSEYSTTNIDLGYDSRRLATIVSLYSHLEDGTKELGIQSRETFNPTIKIPLGFSTLIDEETSYKISIRQIEGVNLNEVLVHLIDKLENEIINLSENDYDFLSRKGTYNNRFIIQFEPEVLSVSENDLESVVIYPNPAKDELTLSNPGFLELDEVIIYDLTGRVIKTIDLRNTGVTKTIPVSDLMDGIYMLRINKGADQITIRMVKKK